MPVTEQESRQLFTQLKPGDRLEIVHEIKVGQTVWNNATRGVVERTERRRHGLHFRRNPDDKSFSDVIVLRGADGSLSTLTMDEFTQLRRI